MSSCQQPLLVVGPGSSTSRTLRTPKPLLEVPASKPMTPWGFRPSVLSLASDYKDIPNRRKFLAYYQQDNERAQKEGVHIPSRPNVNSSRGLRTLQWNLNGWASDNGFRDPSENGPGIISNVVAADADVIILNEYHWGFASNLHKQFEELLEKKLGYTTLIESTVDCPTFVASRRPVLEWREIHLSEERSALVLKTISPPQGQSAHATQENNAMNSTEDCVWIVGTHLDHRNGEKRYQEMQTLLQELWAFVPINDRIILTGDLNQQRRVDYVAGEWDLAIAPSMDKRHTCRDDGVDQLLQGSQFVCSWDSGDHVQCNWKTSRPPSTHWSGTIVDYHYGRHIQAETVNISASGLSDHRMTVCDWKL